MTPAAQKKDRPEEAVGIMGGTFDPIHFGHLTGAEEARVRFNLSRIIFVPNANPPHKKDYPVSLADRRYDMVVLATATHPYFEVSRIEIDRPGLSFTVDTMEALRKQLGTDGRLYFITGADAIVEISSWHEPERLAESCELIAITRPGYDLGKLQVISSAKLLPKVHILEMPGVDISSTELRRRAACGESLRYLTPDPVIRYIEIHRLYQ